MTPQVISLSALGSTAWIPVDYKQNPFNISIACVVSNTPNLTYQVEYTLDDIFDSAITPTAFIHNTITGKTSDFSATQTQPVRAIRLTITAYTSGTVTMTALQGAVNPVIYTPNPITLFQSGVPFWIPPGDGGANGLSLAADGTFTLSAEAPMTSAFNALVSGGYIYLPAGAGGLVAGGWYWCKMTDGTNGRVFAETYSGIEQPAFVSSPTNLSGLTPGRITQITTEIIGPSFTLPGGSMGPNGVLSLMMKWIATNSAGTKTPRIYLGSQSILRVSLTTASVNALVSASRCNMGVQDRQIGVRTNSISGAWDGATGGTTWSGDVITVDTSVDQTISVAATVAVNTDSIIFVPMQFTVQYGA